MPDLLAHYALSILVAKTRFNTKKALLLGVIGVIPDIDALFRLHRWITHSLVLTLVLAGVILPIIYKYKKNTLEYTLTILVLITLHITIDVFTGPTPILWPITSHSYTATLKLNGSIQVDSITLKPQVEITTREVDFTQQYIVEGPIASEIGVITAIAVAVTLILDHTTKPCRVNTN